MSCTDFAMSMSFSRIGGVVFSGLLKGSQLYQRPNPAPTNGVIASSRGTHSSMNLAAGSRSKSRRSEAAWASSRAIRHRIMDQRKECHHGEKPLPAQLRGLRGGVLLHEDAVDLPDLLGKPQDDDDSDADQDWRPQGAQALHHPGKPESNWRCGKPRLRGAIGRRGLAHGNISDKRKKPMHGVEGRRRPEQLTCFAGARVSAPTRSCIVTRGANSERRKCWCR